MVRIIGGRSKEVKDSLKLDTVDLEATVKKIETEESPSGASGVSLNVTYYFFAFFVLRRTIYRGV